ncbi:hypothetical protein ACFU5O_24410 [Streptomyces sp. NPDC057445]|uniref:hypothetical protein n=1 Tax=Streptomyces sp. NPDC057445 TaxID=3346136 RepID=UPI003699A0E5
MHDDGFRGFLFSAFDFTTDGFLFLVVALGLTVGVAVALNRTAVGFFTLVRVYVTLRQRLPWSLMAFLADAHKRRGVLRQVGAVYQFRHIDLQNRLAERP